MRVPLKIITKAGLSKLLGKKTEEIDSEKEDEIATIDPNKKVKFVNIKMSGNADNYKITLEKEKKKQRLN
jgi:hypothetical protein